LLNYDNKQTKDKDDERGAGHVRVAMRQLTILGTDDPCPDNHVIL
jgi:hypothetical protein